jgi:uncharacterized protein (DUF3820 family)
MSFKFDYAKKYVLPFGQYKGKRIDDIAKDDEGLKYLDWLYGETDDVNIKRFLKIYFEDETIKKELEKLVKD